jgi:hypothetical protein
MNSETECHIPLQVKFCPQGTERPNAGDTERQECLGMWLFYVCLHGCISDSQAMKYLEISVQIK